VDSLHLWVPLVGAVSVRLLITAIGAVAHQRGLEQLRGDAFTSQLTVVGLLVVGAVIEVWGVPAAVAIGHDRAMLVLIAELGRAFCLFLALGKAARLCRAAATALDEAPGLPAARIVGSA
jgi:hypothetical protein